MDNQDKNHELEQLARFLGNLDPANFDQSVLNDDWLKERSLSQLVQIIKVLAERLKGEATLKINKADLPPVADEVPVPLPEPTFVSEEIVVPAALISSSPAIQWELTLVPKKQGSRPLRIRILGDFTIGRKTGAQPADLDLTPFGADKMGVSRQHAAIRVTSDGLYLLDLGSTNGTYYKGKQLGLGKPTKITSGGAIAFGSLVLAIATIKHLP